MKIGVRVQELWLNMSFGPSGPNIVSRPQTPKGQHFERFHDFIESNL